MNAAFPPLPSSQGEPQRVAVSKTLPVYWSGKYWQWVADRICGSCLQSAGSCIDLCGTIRHTQTHPHTLALRPICTVPRNTIVFITMYIIISIFMNNFLLIVYLYCLSAYFLTVHFHYLHYCILYQFKLFPLHCVSVFLITEGWVYVHFCHIWNNPSFFLKFQAHSDTEGCTSKYSVQM